MRGSRSEPHERNYNLTLSSFHRESRPSIAEGWVERPSSVAMVRRVQRTPLRLLREVIMWHPALRRSAHRARERLGRLRERARVRDD
jgi:hypothetical protein